MAKTTDSRIGQRMQDRDTLIGSSPRSRPPPARNPSPGTDRRHFGHGGPFERRHPPQPASTSSGRRASDSTTRGSTCPSSTTTANSCTERGVTAAPGLYFLGMPWQHTRGSALLGWVKATPATSPSTSTPRASRPKSRRNRATSCRAASHERTTPSTWVELDDRRAAYGGNRSRGAAERARRRREASLARSALGLTPSPLAEVNNRASYARPRRKSQPTSAPSTSPASGASGTSVVTFTTMPRAKPSAAPSAMAVPLFTCASLWSPRDRPRR